MLAALPVPGLASDGSLAARLVARSLSVRARALWQRGELRPAFDGRNGACHRYVPQFSGATAPPNNVDPSMPQLRLSVNAIGGELAAVDSG